MTPSKMIRLSKVDTAATIEADTDISPEVIFPDGSNGLAVFEFPATPEVVNALVMFEQGLMVNAQKLLRCRLHLLRRAKGGKP